MAVRDKVIGLEKDGQVFTPDVREFLQEALHLPKSSIELNSSIGDANINFLGAPTTKEWNLDEEIALMKLLLINTVSLLNGRIIVRCFPTKRFSLLNPFGLSPITRLVTQSLSEGKWVSIQRKTMFPLRLGALRSPICLGRSLIAEDPSEIVKKCVIATSNEISGMYVVTALVNSFETD